MRVQFLPPQLFHPTLVPTSTPPSKYATTNCVRTKAWLTKANSTMEAPLRPSCKQWRSAGPGDGHVMSVGERRVRRHHLKQPPRSNLYLVRCQWTISKMGVILIEFTGGEFLIPGNRCSSCVYFGVDCTYLEAVKVDIFAFFWSFEIDHPLETCFSPSFTLKSQ